MLRQALGMAATDHGAAQIHASDGTPRRHSIEALHHRLALDLPVANEASKRRPGDERVAGRAIPAATARPRHFGSVDRRKANAGPARAAEGVAIGDRGDLAGKSPAAPGPYDGDVRAGLVILSAWRRTNSKVGLHRREQHGPSRR